MGGFYHKCGGGAAPDGVKTNMGVAALLLLLAGGQSPAGVPQTVAHVDLDRYGGQWFEVARYDNRFQRKCQGDVVVSYARRPDGRIDVDNRCRTTDGDTIQARGVARLATDDGSNSKLEVRFAPAWLSFIDAVWGDYWIVGLADDYRYAVVGSANREYLWLLAREAAPPERDVESMMALARAQGFDPGRLVRTTQSGQVPQAR
jgi:apolipoprotein D and lipocalin family protein